MWKKFFKGLAKVEDFVAAVLLSAVVLITVINVLARYVLRMSLPWSQDVSGICWTWTIMISMAIGYRRNLHYGVDFMTTKLSRKNAVRLKLVVYVLMLFTAIFLFAMSIVITQNGWVKTTAFLKIPYFYKYISAVIGFGLVIIHTIRYIVLGIRKPDQFFDCIVQGGLPGLDGEDMTLEKEGADA